MSVRPTSRPTTLASIQVLRGLAALAIVVHHAGYDADTIAVRLGVPQLGLDRFIDLSFGIHVFFVISGFIMVRTAEGFGEPGASARFIVRRLLRVAPLYWLMTTLVLVGAVLAPSLLNAPIEGWPLLLGSYLFVPVMRANGEIRPILGQGWTLNYEMFFYVLFACTMVLPRRLAVAALTVLLVGLVLLGSILRPEWPPALVWTDGLLLEFLFGVAVGLVLDAGLKLRGWVAWGLMLLGGAAAVWLGPWSPRFDGVHLWLRDGIPAALIVAGAVLGPAWRRCRPVLILAALGDVSYSLYLAHPFAIRAMRVGWSAAIGTALPLWIFLLASCAVSIGLAILVFRSVERPMTRALHRRFAGNGPRRPASSAPEFEPHA